MINICFALVLPTALPLRSTQMKSRRLSRTLVGVREEDPRWPPLERLICVLPEGFGFVNDLHAEAESPVDTAKAALLDDHISLQQVELLKSLLNPGLISKAVV